MVSFVAAVAGVRSSSPSGSSAAGSAGEGSAEAAGSAFPVWPAAGTTAPVREASRRTRVAIGVRFVGGARTESSLMPRNYGPCDPGRKSDRMGADGQLLTRSSHVQLLYACLIRHTQKGVDLCPEKWGGHSDNNATAGVGNGGPATRRTRFDEEEPITFRWLLTGREMNDLSHDAPLPSLNRCR